VASTVASSPDRLAPVDAGRCGRAFRIPTRGHDARLYPALVNASRTLRLGFASARTPASTARKADPLDARASVPAVAYESAFSRYRRAADDKAIPWRDANDTAARTGGWRTYAREAQQPEPALPASPASAAQPAQADPKLVPSPQGHGGHKMP
jgi:hypothetical protein